MSIGGWLYEIGEAGGLLVFLIVLAPSILGGLIVLAVCCYRAYHKPVSVPKPEGGWYDEEDDEWHEGEEE